MGDVVDALKASLRLARVYPPPPPVWLRGDELPTETELHAVHAQLSRLIREQKRWREVK
jgi:hypothetical protein